MTMSGAIAIVWLICVDILPRKNWFSLFNDPINVNQFLVYRFLVYNYIYR